MQDLVGQIFGKLTVVGPSGKPYHVVCQCSCGKTVEARKSNLTSSHTKSCGCGRYGEREATKALRAMEASRQMFSGEQE